MFQLVTLTWIELYLYSVVLLGAWTFSVCLTAPGPGDDKARNWLILAILCLLWPIGFILIWLYGLAVRKGKVP